jgi:hypothetical protein
VGTHSIVATYGGDGSYHGAGSAALIPAVSPPHNDGAELVE